MKAIDIIFASLIGFALGAMCLTFVLRDGHGDGYRQGQIDALSGTRIEYRLELQPDGSRVWTRLDKPTTRPAATD